MLMIFSNGLERFLMENPNEAKTIIEKIYDSSLEQELLQKKQEN